MDPIQIKNIAQRLAPEVCPTIHKTFFRHDILKHLQTQNGVGIELGVAGGEFSKRMVTSNKFSKFYGVDLYEDHHNTEEYLRALKLIGFESNYTLLRMSFDDAIELFEDNFFDFIYFDGYAHTGEEGGKTFSDWYRKLKVGGMFAGDDYHDDWPLVKWAVNDMVSKLGCDLHITGMTENTNLNKYPSWFFTKLSNSEIAPDPNLHQLGLSIRNATRRKSNGEISISLTQLETILKQVKKEHPELGQKLKAFL